MSNTTGNKLTDHKFLIFDVYGTLADWESGIFNGLQPLLAKYPASQIWTRKDILEAYMSVETDVQAQFPDMLYIDVLVKVHEVLEERLKALSGAEQGGTTTGTSLTDDPAAASASDADASTSGIGPAKSKADMDAEDAHKAFGNSIQNWPIFPDTCDALKRLAEHFKLVVLSNVDRDSFRHTHALLSEGPSRASVTSDASVYTYPSPNPNKYWHPQATPNSQSPFSLILTAQDTGCYKPALGGFRAAFDYIAAQPQLFGDLQLGPGEEVKDRVLSVAQSLPHDHEPASLLGMRSVWIDRQGALTCNVTPGGPDAKSKWKWRFETLGEMANAVEKELAEA